MSEKIYHKKLNEVHHQLVCEPSVAQDLSDHFSFFAPNYQYMPLYKKGIWDGKVRLFNAGRCTLYGGLLPHLKKYCKTYSYTLEEIENEELVPPEIPSVETMMAFADSLALTIGKKRVTMKTYQREAVVHALTNEKALLVSPTASGKSLIAYVLIRVLTKFFPLKKCLIIVPTVGLVQQLFSDFLDYSGGGSLWKVTPHVHMIFSGQEKESVKPVHISTYQSLMNVPKPYFHKYNMVVVDEAHLATADSIKKILDNSINCYFRIGMTGTVKDSVCHKLMLEGMLGQIYQVTTTKELIKNKDVAELQIDCIILEHDKKISTIIRGMSFQEEADYVVGNEARNNFLVNLVNGIEGNTLLLFQYVDKHGKVLRKLLEEKGNKKIFYISGEVTGEVREEIRKFVDANKNCVVVASYGTASTGMSIKNLNNVVFASPYKSKIRLLQSIGRGLRVSDTKTSVKIYDIADDISSGNYKNYGLKHLTERVKTYVQQEFPYKIIRVVLAAKTRSPK